MYHFPPTDLFIYIWVYLYVYLYDTYMGFDVVMAWYKLDWYVNRQTTSFSCHQSFVCSSTNRRAVLFESLLEIAFFRQFAYCKWQESCTAAHALYTLCWVVRADGKAKPSSDDLVDLILNVYCIDIFNILKYLWLLTIFSKI